MPGNAPVLDCSAEDKASLIAMSMSRTEEARMVERARILLSRLEGKQLKQIARDQGISIPTVTKWCKRFSFWRMRGLFDEPRPGRPVKYGDAFRDSVLAVLEENPPAGMSRWDGPAVAERLGSSVHAVWRVLQRQGIHLQRSRTRCVSNDKNFATKAADVVGLYLDPPAEAVVLSVDEKPSIQAIERPTGYVKTENSGIVRAQQSTYKRHGTVNLFASLDVATGHVMSEITETKKRADFQSFLGQVIAAQPVDKQIHVILDNYCTHKKTKNGLNNSMAASIFISPQPRPVGSIRSKSCSACCNARLSPEPVSPANKSCAR